MYHLYAWLYFKCTLCSSCAITDVSIWMNECFYPRFYPPQRCNSLYIKTVIRLFNLLFSWLIIHFCHAFSLNQTCLSHVGSGDQRHGISSCPPGRLCVGGKPDTCSHYGELLSVQDTLGVALFGFWLCCLCQHCCVLASWHQSTNKEKHTKL